MKIRAYGQTQTAKPLRVAAGLFALCFALPAGALQATASGMALIESTTGVGVAYSVRRNLLTATFLARQADASISVRADEDTDRFLPGQQGVITDDGMIIVLADQMVSVNLAAYAPGKSTSLRPVGSNSVMVLAQFN